MNPSVKALLDAIRTGERQTAEAAVLVVAMLLEQRRGGRITATPENQQLYKEVFSVELQRIVVSPEQHVEIVKELESLVRSGPFRSSIIWAIGKSLPEPGVRSLLELCRSGLGAFDQECLYQWCVALRDLLEFAHYSAETASIQRLLQDSNVVAVLNQMSRSSERRLSQNAQALMGLLQRTLTNFG